MCECSPPWVCSYKVIGTCPKGKEDVGAATGVDELIVTDVIPGTPYEDYASVDITAKVSSHPPPHRSLSGHAHVVV